MNAVQLGERRLGRGEPIFLVAEIGINHNGELDDALALVDVAADAGCDAVKLQKRTPVVCVPDEMRDVVRETPWGKLTYLEYRERIELSEDACRAVAARARERGLLWFASSWDEPSVDLLESLAPVCHKVPSACLTDHALLDRLRDTGRPILLSTGMSTMAQIRAAVERLRRDRLVVLHSTSAYPCAPEELNLRVIETLRTELDVPIGYSGHERGLAPTLAAAALGACVIERHITLDRARWGSDQAASLERDELVELVRGVRQIEVALGDGDKRVYPSERAALERLRRRK